LRACFSRDTSLLSLPRASLCFASSAGTSTALTSASSDCQLARGCRRAGMQGRSGEALRLTEGSLQLEPSLEAVRCMLHTCMLQVLHGAHLYAAGAAWDRKRLQQTGDASICAQHVWRRICGADSQGGHTKRASTQMQPLCSYDVLHTPPLPLQLCPTCRFGQDQP
jgi:hypothetical protein